MTFFVHRQRQQDKGTRSNQRKRYHVGNAVADTRHRYRERRYPPCLSMGYLETRRATCPAAPTETPAICRHGTENRCAPASNCCGCRAHLGLPDFEAHAAIHGFENTGQQVVQVVRIDQLYWCFLDSGRQHRLAILRIDRRRCPGFHPPWSAFEFAIQRIHRIAGGPLHLSRPAHLTRVAQHFAAAGVDARKCFASRANS